MFIRLCIVEGPRKGEEFVVKGDITIGRSHGDLQLKDPKSSSRHARISINSEGIAEIEDMGSSNGTSVNGAKIKKSVIKPGDRIQIGSTKIRIEKFVPESASSELDKGTWQKEVDKALSDALFLAEKPPLVKFSYGPFLPPLSFEFVKGVQAGTAIIFSFGPRKAGSAGTDALLFEPNCPPIAFELIPSKPGDCTLTSHSHMVRVNGVESKSQKLVDGDKIEIGNTQIIVKALRDL